MMERREPVTLASTSLRSFFHDSVQSAIRNQNVQTRDETIWYLINLLDHFSRSERLFDDAGEGRGLRPLADLYAQAVNATSRRERRVILQRMGDVALFVTGLFSGLFTRRRRLVDVDYYAAMGGGAYAAVCEALGGSVGHRSLVETFDDLSRQFILFADVLAEVGESAFGCTDGDLLRLHERWRLTESPRLAAKLREAGIEPQHIAGLH